MAGVHARWARSPAALWRCAQFRAGSVLGCIGTARPGGHEGPSGAACTRIRPQGHRADWRVLRHHPVGGQRGLPVPVRVLHPNAQGEQAAGPGSTGQLPGKPALLPTGRRSAPAMCAKLAAWVAVSVPRSAGDSPPACPAVRVAAQALMPVAVFTVGVLFGTDKYNSRTFANMVLVTIGVAVASYGARGRQRMSRSRGRSRKSRDQWRQGPLLEPPTHVCQPVRAAARQRRSGSAAEPPLSCPVLHLCAACPQAS